MSKNLKKLLCIAVSIMFTMLIATFSTFASDNLNNYKYGLKPGTDEWENLNHGERVLASQIPTEVLMTLTTEELVNSVLNYPCFVDMIFYNTYTLYD